MRALIVDDEPAARRRLGTLLEELGVAIEGEAADGVAALDLVRERRPDVIFLDISMPEVDGFDVARHLPHPRPLIIFQTAYSRFAVQAFEHEALDYVVKPVSRKRLAQAVERARRRLGRDRGDQQWDVSALSELRAALGHRPARPERLLVRHGAGHRLLSVAAIERFLAADGVVCAVSDGTQHGTDYTLQELEERLTGAFVRASRADLVNISHIAGIARGGDGSASLTLTSGVMVHVSRRRAAGVRSLLRC